MDPHGEKFSPVFKVGDLAESRSFISGFRGAWFRCKIKKTKVGRRQLIYLLEFFDFPDEKLTWTHSYQKNTEENLLQNGRKSHLMLRPKFPTVYSESQMPDLHEIPGVIAVVDGWKVGDLVDWWCEDCFWSGKVTHLLGTDMVKIKLNSPPFGEGGIYDALAKDLRPSLDWSPEHGWTVPLSMVNGNNHYCARLIQPLVQDEERDDENDGGGPSRDSIAAVALNKERDDENDGGGPSRESITAVASNKERDDENDGGGPSRESITVVASNKERDDENDGGGPSGETITAVASNKERDDENDGGGSSGESITAEALNEERDDENDGGGPSRESITAVASNKERDDENDGGGLLRESITAVASSESGDHCIRADIDSSYSSGGSSLRPMVQTTVDRGNGSEIYAPNTANSGLDDSGGGKANCCLEDTGGGKASCLDKTSQLYDKALTNALPASASTSRNQRYESIGPSNMRVSEDELFDSMICCDTIESSILRLEELVAKIDWIKGILQYGPQWSNSMKPSWKFMENRAFTRK